MARLTRRGAPLSEYVASLTLLDGNGVAISDGSATLTITDENGATVLGLTGMPYSSGGVYKLVLADSYFPTGTGVGSHTYRLVTMTGYAADGTLLATRRVYWVEDGS